ncbi:hypothetical protein ACIBF7_19575 [Nonomuraea sp. NPDC050478]|uniref:hypothetical protein n=1 Tax=Nonomuraea sp. NPDC050478 TaxID=3364365 RepID=UPI0037AA78CC
MIALLSGVADPYGYRMSSPRHRMHLADRVKRLELRVFATGTDVAELKTAVKQLPSTIRKEILDYTEPVFGEIMAGHATLPTRKDLQGVEQRLTEKFEHRFSDLDSRLDGVDARLDRMDTRLDSVDARLDRIDTRLDGVDERLDRIDTRLDGVDERLDRIDTRLDRMDTRFDSMESHLRQILAVLGKTEN